LKRNPATSKIERPENNNENNIFPSCPQCNNYKHSMTVEEFRDQIRFSIVRLYNSASYRNAIRFGLVKEQNWDGKFYFEKVIKQEGDLCQQQ
jgi:hypothetical protein